MFSRAKQPRWRVVAGRGQHTSPSRGARTMSRMRQSGLVTAAYCAALLTMAAAGAAAQGTLTGTVTSQGTNTPLQEARVIVVGTSLFTTTSADGKFIIRKVPVGTAEVRVIRVGYTEQKKPVAILDGQPAT